MLLQNLVYLLLIGGVNSADQWEGMILQLDLQQQHIPHPLGFPKVGGGLPAVGFDFLPAHETGKADAALLANLQTDTEEQRQEEQSAQRLDFGNDVFQIAGIIYLDELIHVAQREDADADAEQEQKRPGYPPGRTQCQEQRASLSS